jgi:hypothetical protein
MSVIKEERDCLGRVLRRYQATGTIDAVLAEVEGGWAGALGSGRSPVSSTSPARPPAAHADAEWRSVSAAASEVSVTGEPDHREARVAGDARRFELVPDRSVVLIEVRSTVGPISFGALGVTGSIVADVADGAIRPGSRPAAHMEVAVDSLRSGNSVYDAELLRRISARRFPRATIALQDCVPVGSGSRYRLSGELTFHGVTRPVHGTVSVTASSSGRLVVTGEQVFDIRDFNVPSPTVLMFRIYPDVRVRVHVEAEVEEA